MNTLLSKLEAATEGSRELDDAIASAVLNPGGELRLEGMPNGSPGLKTWFYPDGTRGTSLNYTTSIDAALTLLKGMWCIYAMEDPGCSYLPANSSGDFLGAKQIVVNHPVPTIALCIAALRARSSQGDK